MEHTRLKAEEFLREKLESQIESFGDGLDEFHTREIGHLLRCLDEKDEVNGQLVDALETLIALHNYQESEGPKPTYEQWKTAFESAQETLNKLK